jgi:Mrp family chromosome partitioning ATPase
MSDSLTDEQPVDIHQYTRAIRHALPRLIALALIAAVTAGVASSVLPHKTYKASTTIVARDTLGTNQLTDATTVARRLATVNLLTRTTRVLSLAASKLPGTTVEQLRSSVQSTVDPSANAITITASADSAQEAAARANRVAPALIRVEHNIEEQTATAGLQKSLRQLRQLRAEGATAAVIQAAEGRISALAAGAASTASGFDVVQVAEPPAGPSSPPPVFSAAVAFFAFALLGVLFVLAREQLAPAASSGRELEQLYGAPILGSLRVVRGLRPGELANLPAAVRDAYYVLAAAVRDRAQEQGARVVFVVSAVGGEGRTATVANLAQALSATGLRVLAVSADLRAPMLHKWLGTPPSPGLTDVLAAAGRSDRRGIERALRSAAVARDDTFGSLASGEPTHEPASLLFGNDIGSVFDTIRTLPADLVLVDTPPGCGFPDVHALAPHADALLVVARTHRLRLSRATVLRDILDQFDDKPRLGLAIFDGGAQRIRRHARRDPTRAATQAPERHDVVELR